MTPTKAVRCVLQGRRSMAEPRWCPLHGRIHGAFRLPAAPPVLELRAAVARLSDHDLDVALDAARRGDLQPAEGVLAAAAVRAAREARRCSKCGTVFPARKARRCRNCHAFASWLVTDAPRDGRRNATGEK